MAGRKSMMTGRGGPASPPLLSESENRLAWSIVIESVRSRREAEATAEGGTLRHQHIEQSIPAAFRRPSLDIGKSTPISRRLKIDAASDDLATIPWAPPALALRSVAIMAAAKGNSIPALFQASKRLRVDAGTLAFSAQESGELDGEKKSVKAGAMAAKSFDLHPLPGFEPLPQRPIEAVGAESKSVPESTAQEGEEGSPVREKGSELTTAQRMRMELNKTVARAKRNTRTCEERIAESRKTGKSFPEFQDLLVEQSWLDVLQGEFTKQYMTKLHTFVQQEAAGRLPVYPPAPLVFNAFNTCPFDKVKVVIIGQDPYHGPGQAMGLSFSVPQGTKVPSSLVNIFKEIRDDVGSTIPSHGNLEKWAHQGVLMLNAVLTVREHHANSHAKKGWEPFTDAAIRAVSQQRKGVIFLLWGNSALDKTRLINVTQHHILKAAHPSGLSAHKGFFNCRHFSKTNQLLEKAGELPIDWQL